MNILDTLTGNDALMKHIMSHLSITKSIAIMSFIKKLNKIRRDEKLENIPFERFQAIAIDCFGEAVRGINFENPTSQDVELALKAIGLHDKHVQPIKNAISVLME